MLCHFPLRCHEWCRCSGDSGLPGNRSVAWRSLAKPSGRNFNQQSGLSEYPGPCTPHPFHRHQLLDGAVVRNGLAYGGVGAHHSGAILDFDLGQVNEASLSLSADGIAVNADAVIGSTAVRSRVRMRFRLICNSLKHFAAPNRLYL